MRREKQSITGTSAPPAAPVVVVEKIDHLSHTLRILDAQHPKRLPKPDHLEGYDVYYKIGGPAPTTPEQCDFVGTIRRARAVVAFGPETRNKTVWYIAVAVDTRHRRGPKSDTISATIAA
jgi:hypothetical protein